jgi:hypothetical protein
MGIVSLLGYRWGGDLKLSGETIAQRADCLDLHKIWFKLSLFAIG